MINIRRSGMRRSKGKQSGNIHIIMYNQGERGRQDEAYDKDNHKEQHRMNILRERQRSRREKKRVSRGEEQTDEEEQHRGI
eukprot:5857661-Heterocapsa_arctica.AAC.1